MIKCSKLQCHILYKLLLHKVMCSNIITHTSYKDKCKQFKQTFDAILYLLVSQRHNLHLGARYGAIFIPRLCKGGRLSM